MRILTRKLSDSISIYCWASTRCSGGDNSSSTAFLSRRFNLLKNRLNLSFNKLDSSDKNKTEKFVKVDKSDSSDTTTNFGGPSGPTPGILKIDFSSNFRSGEYKLSGSDLQQMNSKLQKIKDFVTNSKSKTFKYQFLFL